MVMPSTVRDDHGDIDLNKSLFYFQDQLRLIFLYAVYKPAPESSENQPFS
jgi:hypothetical protein